MDWKKHLKWGLIVIIILTIVLVLATLFVDYIEVLGVFSGSKIIILGVVLPNLLLAFLFGLYALILPDVDIGTSKAFAVTYMILILIMFYFLMFTEYIFPVFISLVLMLFILGLKHRGVTHEWYAPLIVGCVIGFLFSSYLIGIYVIAGYYTHLGCDAV